MDVIADATQSSLEAMGHTVSSVTPRSPLERWHRNRLVMRYLRYVHYPRYAKRNGNQGADIQHVIDHGYAHLLPALSSPVKISNVHDLIPMLTWRGKIDKNTSLPRKPVLNLHSLNYLQRFDHLITISESTSRDLQEYLNIDDSMVSVIPPVLNPIFKPIDKHKIVAFKRDKKLDDDTKWILLSGREYYKNHQTAVQAVKLLSDRCDCRIGILRIGLASPEFDALLERYGMQDRAKSMFVKHTDLPILYNAVDCLLFPSLYEGFGMPVAEATACGTPVVTSNRGALPEVAPSLALSYDALDAQGLAQGLEKALDDDQYRAMLKTQGIVAMSKYHPKQIGVRLQSVYQKLLS